MELYALSWDGYFTVSKNILNAGYAAASMYIVYQENDNNNFVFIFRQS